MRWVLLAFSSMFISGCAVGSASAAYSLRAKTATELTSEAEDRIIQKAVKATVDYLAARHLIKSTETPEVPQGQSGVERGM